MAVEVVAASASCRPLFERLVELYLYDFSEILPIDVGEDGRFGDDDLDGCWTDPRRHPFVIRVNGHTAGFAIVDQGSTVTGEASVFDMGEFFIMRRYRRSGYGRQAAAALFARFPGPWEVRVIEGNQAALAFWRTVISVVAGDTLDSRRWVSPSGRVEVVFAFSTDAEPPI